MKQKVVGIDTVESNFYNELTGEITNQELESKIHKIVVSSKDMFVQQYSEIIGVIKGLNGSDVKLLIYCSSHAEINTNRINLTKPICMEISELFDMSYSSIKASITHLKNKDILISLGSGTYRINPKYYWKGNSNDRLKTMKYVLEIECPDCL